MRNNITALYGRASMICLAIALAQPLAAQAVSDPAGQKSRQDQTTSPFPQTTPSGTQPAGSQSAEQPQMIAPEAGAVDAASVETAQEVVITGTAIRGVAPVGSATVTLSKEALLQSPVRDAAQILKDLPQGSNLGLQEIGGSSPNVSRASGVNLRGLGPNATLVLFDNHRIAPQGVTDQIVDPNIIPFGAIERVEVVTDGASSLYGSDAVAGVVNYRLRRNYEGAEVTGRYVSADLYHGAAVEGVLGHSWGRGSAMLGFSFDHRTGFNRYDVARLRQDLRPFGGNDNRFLPGSTVATPGAVGNILITSGANAGLYGIPTSGSLTAANVLASRNKPNLDDSSKYVGYLPDRKRWSLIGRLRQEIGSNFEVSYTGVYSNRTSTYDSDVGSAQITVPSSSPYYIQGLVPNNGPYNVVYSLQANGYVDGQRSTDRSYNHIFEAKGDLGRFQVNAYATLGRTEGCGVCHEELNVSNPLEIGRPTNLQTILIPAGLPNALNPTVAFNPYAAGPQPAAWDRLAQVVRQSSTFRLFDTGLNVNGDLFDLPGGTVKAAVGGEHYYTKQKFLRVAANRTTDGRLLTTRKTSADRTVDSVFGEVFVPIFGPDNAVPFFNRLVLNAALRHDRYDDVGSTTNPKFGVTWKPVESLSLRASWGKAFRAPTLTESNPGVIEILTRALVANGLSSKEIPLSNAAGQTAVLQRAGNTTGLQPEHATVWSAGADFDPTFVPGLHLSVTYYNVNYRDRIETVPNIGSWIASDANRALYSNFIIVAPQPTTCVNGDPRTFNPLYQSFYSNPNTTQPGGTNPADCAFQAIFNGGQQNLGRVVQDGLDFTVNYRVDTQAGTFFGGGTFSKILTLKKSILADAPLINVKDTIGFQVSERGRGNIGWSKNGFVATAYVNYVGPYLNNQPITLVTASGNTRLPNARVHSWTTFDANLRYDFADDQGGLLRGFGIGIGVQNLAARKPPLVLTGTESYDANNANFFGRIWTFEVTKKF